MGVKWFQYTPKTILRGLLIAPIVNLLVLMQPASATEVAFVVPEASDSFIESIEGASLTLRTTDNDEAVAQDFLAAARADYSNLILALYNQGFYGGVIRILADGRDVAEIPALSAPEKINQIVIRVDPGAPFFFDSVRVAPLASGTTLPDEFRTGKRAFATAIRNAASQSVDDWRDAGHAKAGIVEQSVTANHATNQISADIKVSTGPRLRFGALLVDKTSRVRPGRVRAIAGLPSGEIFSPDALEKASRRLRASGAFQSVVLMEGDVAPGAEAINITAELVDAKPRRFGFGAEIASLEGLSLSAFWLHRNLLGGAERLRFNAEVGGIGGDSGGIDFNVGVRYERPATFSPDTQLFILANIDRTEDPEFTETTAQIGAGLSHVFSDTLSAEAGIRYQFSDIEDDLGGRQLQHLLFPASVTYDTRDNVLNAKSGIFVDLDVTPFIGLDQDSLGARVFADARTYIGVGQSNRFVVALRSQVGSVAGAALDELPQNMLFFSGGAGTVRGQPFQDLGVDLGGGLTVGGRSFFALSGELRAQVSDSWSVVGFADTGFVGEDSFGTGDGEFHAGAGFGVRYNTGIGPVRLDIATPVGSDAGSTIEFYIGIGQAF